MWIPAPSFPLELIGTVLIMIASHVCQKLVPRIERHLKLFGNPLGTIPLILWVQILFFRCDVVGVVALAMMQLAMLARDLFVVPPAVVT